ncbi:LysR substrate-binding domain-containing protein [Sphingomonas oligophenolica]|uniref:LysR substrate-binding domain-containing protein n=1 Tax=Sphingomonas oligophenolica TaxID=301154 RepID=UPI0031F51CDE
MDHTGALAGIPLAKLHVFDAASRHKNLVRAAVELRMTQSAVSRHIKALEEHLGVKLFHRGPRGVLLTESGDLLADYVRRAFGELSTGLYRLGQPRRRESLVVIVPRSFALRILAPRLGSFVREYPWIDLRIDTHRYYDELEQSQRDIAIRAGDGHWPDMRVERLTSDTFFPICAPSLRPPEAALAESWLRANILLHYSERRFWPLWLQTAGYDAEIGHNGPQFSETAFALTAAESGHGVAIARGPLVADALRSGRLVRPFAAEIVDGSGYFVVVRKNAPRNAMITAFTEWLIEQMADLQRAIETS